MWGAFWHGSLLQEHFSTCRAASWSLCGIACVKTKLFLNFMRGLHRWLIRLRADSSAALLTTPASAS
eukprot:3152382-Pyramimonas_sp.AAC.1